MATISPATADRIQKRTASRIPSDPLPAFHRRRIDGLNSEMCRTQIARARRTIITRAAIVLGVMVCLAIAMALSTRRAHAQTVDDRYPFLATQALASAPIKHGRIRRFEPSAGVIAMVDLAAWGAGVPARIAHAVVRIESRYRTNARSGAGALGMMQIKCASARGIGFSGNCRDLFDAQTNLTWGLKFLRLALDKGGQGCAGISLYNVGIYARPHCTGYGRRVMAMAR